jgi:RNA recognition motif-containing protein
MNTLKELLYDLFVPFGQIIDIVAERTLKKKGQAFIVFVDPRAAATARTALNGVTFRGKKISVEFAKSRSRASEIFHGIFAPRPVRKLRASVAVPMSLAMDVPK